MSGRFLLPVAIFAMSQTVSAQTPRDTLEDRTLQQVTVTASRRAGDDGRYVAGTMSVVPRGQLTKNFRTSIMPSISELVPGLFVTSRGVLGYGVSTGAAGTVKLRGIGSGAQMLVLVDGQPQYAGLMGHPVADVYQTMMTQQVEVMRGPSSVLYGSNAMGGAVNIVTRQVAADGSHTTLQMEGGSYGTVQAQAVNQTKCGRFSSTAGLGWAHTDGHRANSRFLQYSGFAKLGYEFSPNLKATADVNVTHFNASNPGEESNPYIDNDSKITRGLASLQLQGDYGKVSGAVRAFYDWGHHNINDGYHPGGTPQTQLYLHNDVMSGASAYANLRLLRGNRTTVGFDWQHFGGKAWNRVIATRERKTLADKRQDEIAGYVDMRQEIVGGLALNAGVRVDRHSAVGTEVVPQAAVSYLSSGGYTWRASVGKGFRNPTLRELYMFRPANADLHPERLMNYEVSLAGNPFAGRMHIGVNVFYIKAENLISTVTVDGKMKNVNTGRTENCGVEIEARYKASNCLALNANYSYLHMSNPVTGAPENKLYAGADWTKNRWQVATGVQWIGGLYLSTGSSAVKENFVLWNLTASCRVAKPVKLYVRGENLLAQRYQTMLGFLMPRATIMAGATLDI